MNAIDVGIGVGFVAMFGGVVAAAWAGDPDVHERLQRGWVSQKTTRMRDLDQQIVDRRLVGGYRSAPRDTQDLESKLRRVENEPEPWWLGSDGSWE